MHHWGLAAIAVLATGVVIAAITTTDPLWWHLHFSRLGMFNDFSGHMFNSTVILAGILLATYGVLVVTALPVQTRRRASRAFQGSIVSAGLHLTAVGLVPIPVSPELHGIIASGLGISLLALVSTSLGIPGIHHRFRRMSALCVVLLVTGMVVLTMGVITLACFEFVGFTSVGVWLALLPSILTAACRPPLTALDSRQRTKDFVRWDSRRPSMRSHADGEGSTTENVIGRMPMRRATASLSGSTLAP